MFAQGLTFILLNVLFLGSQQCVVTETSVHLWMAIGPSPSIVKCGDSVLSF